MTTTESLAVIEQQTAAPAIDWGTLEKVVNQGDLSGLSAQDRISYYRTVCEAVGLNPATQPFEYIKLSGKLTLYATRRCTDQLRRIHGVSISRLDKEIQDGLYVVTAYASTNDGRQDSDMGAVALGNAQGEPRANIMMKAVTKAKRRVTLSICGLGFLDETEVETIPGAVRITAEGDVIEAAVTTESQPASATPPAREPDRGRNKVLATVMERCGELGQLRGGNEPPPKILRSACQAVGIQVANTGELDLKQLQGLLQWVDTQIGYVKDGANRTAEPQKEAATVERI